MPPATRPSTLLSIVPLALCTLAPSLAGCSSPFAERRSISYGTTTRGRLWRAARLPPRGPGYVQPERWRVRGRSYGTDELVALLRAVARRLHRADPDGAPLAVADLSRKGGGRIKLHRSHASGRDADLVFFHTDAHGRSRLADEMVRFGPTGRARDGQSDRRFDDRRNWLLVRELLVAPEAQVQYIFVDDPLRARLLAEGVRQGEDAELLARAADVLRRPSRRAPHDDHFHVRIYCSTHERRFGCRDFGIDWAWRKKKVRWLVAKKWKPAPPLPGDPRALGPLVADGDPVLPHRFAR